MNPEYREEELQAQWGNWHELQSQIRELERLVACGHEALEQHSVRMAELRHSEESAHKQFKKMLGRRS